MTRRPPLLPWALSLVAGAALLGADLARSLEPPRWFRGNTHTHTNRCDHADSSPEQVAAWYLERGYHFLVLSEHEVFIDPATVKLPEPRRPDFVLVPGEELTGPRGIHSTALGISKKIDGTAPKETPAAEVVGRHVERSRAAGGAAILNHPNYRWGVKAADALAVPALELLEVHNGHPAVMDEGDATHPSTEDLWDTLLGAGRKVWGVASDDAHHFQGDWSPDRSNAGRGWIVVEAARCEPAAIVAAIRAGEFHASSGVVLASLRASPGRIELAVDEAATRAEVERGLAVGRKIGGARRSVDGGAPRLRIEAVGKGGRVLATTAGPKAEFDLPAGEPYLRVRVTWSRPAGDHDEAFFAWTQPVFAPAEGEFK